MKLKMIRFTLFLFFIIFTTMQSEFNIENLITYLRSKKKRIFFLVILFTVSYTCFRVYTNLSKYESQLRFYVTNSEAVDYKSILDKGFIDISGENRDLLRLQSFGYSNQLLNQIVDSIPWDEYPFLSVSNEKIAVLDEIASLYQVGITDLGELEVTVNHTDRAFSYFLSHQIMNGVNRMNNLFLSEFKQDQIEASERQLKMLDKEKKEVLTKISSLSKKINESEQSIIESLTRQIKNSNEIQESLASLGLNSPEKLELNLSYQRIQNIDKNIESFNRALYNDRWSLEMLKKKKPFITQDKPVRNRLSVLNVVILLLTSGAFFTFLIVLVYALRFRYKVFFNLMFS